MVLPNFLYEKRLWEMDYEYVGGVDEVGRGCFAGPVVAACVVFSSDIQKANISVKINDSKKLTSLQREKADLWIKANCISWGIGQSSASLINRVGINKATQISIRRAVASVNCRLERNVDYLLLDAFYIPFMRGFPKRKGKKLIGIKKKEDGFSLLSSNSRQLAIIKGDERSFSISAGSIIAKVYRDTLMKEIGQRTCYRKFDWVNNKGYGSKRHQQAILKYGITSYHRRQFIDTFLSNSSFSRVQ